MNNEPVAWMHQNPDYAISKHQSLEFNIPLYTHPVKELTDEEMYQLAEECGFNVDGKAINDGIETAADFHNELFDFARAILRKAQEK